MSLTWNVDRMVDKRCACGVLVGRLEGNSPVGRPKRNWKDNIKVDLQEVG